MSGSSVNHEERSTETVEPIRILAEKDNDRTWISLKEQKNKE